MPQTAENRNFDRDEVNRFDRMSQDWWNPKGPMRPLHQINPVRLSWLKRVICAHFGRDENDIRALEGLTILDIGCGAGLLCEPLTRMGAVVTGLDPAPGNVDIARAHAAQSGLDITYRQDLAETLVAEGAQFDVVLAMEVVEHVPDVPGFVENAAQMVRPGGFFAGSTLNRTLKAFALAIVGAEYVLRWLPTGTHRYDKFVTPQEFADALCAAGLHPEAPEGMIYNPLRDQWLLNRDTSVNYFISAVKAG